MRRLHRFTSTPTARRFYLSQMAAQSIVATVVLALGEIPMVSPAFFVVATSLYALTERNIRRGHREAERDRGDQGSSTIGDFSVTYTGTLHSAYSAALNTAIGASARVDPLPTRQSDEPIRAWKRGRIMLEEGLPVFHGVSRGGSYTADDRARCVARNDYYVMFREGIPRVPIHTHGPVLECTCGFYAMAGEAKPDGIQGAPLLEVELYGKVIVCEYGYRAERQRVLGVTLPRQCASALCVADASLVTFVDYELACLCAEHAALTEHTPLLTPATASDLAGVLGTEVRWAA